MITIGSCYYPAAGDAERRQQLSRASLIALGDGVHRVNLQFVDEAFRPAGFETLSVLQQDSRTVTGRGGARKPIVSEMFDALAAAAFAHGDRYFAYLNADIEVSAEAIRRIDAAGRDAYAFCRVDLAPGTRAAQGVLLIGLDLFAVSVDWWRAERRRFRPYIAGEPFWDNVYAAVIGSHGRAAIVDDDPGIFHEQHAGTWGSGPFAEYNGYLAALDAPYFSRWVHYVAGLQAGLAAGTIDRMRLMREIFAPPVLGVADLPRHAARVVRAWARYSFRRQRIGSRPPASGSQ
jgi:hypothetical protein